MHSVLLIVEKPPTNLEGMIFDGGDRARWNDFLNQSHSLLHKAQGIERLGEGTLLLRTNSAMSQYAALILLADRVKLSYRTLFFTDEPKWIVTTPS